MSATSTSPLPRVVLFCREGTSDKEYHAAIEKRVSGFVVTFAFGRRGATLKPGLKTAEPVDFAAATKVYEKLVQEKMGKGYRASTEPVGATYVTPSGLAKADDSIPVMLLEPVDDATRFLRDAAWVAQPKYDGIRLVLKLAGGRVTAQNRKGQDRGFPTCFAEGVLALGVDDVALDGEAVGETFFAFDVVRLNGSDTRPLPYRDRLDLLASLFARPVPACLRLAVTARSANEKAALLAQLKADEAEGVVFKRTDARYIGARTPQAVKHKFWASATIIVIARNDTGHQIETPAWVRVPANKADGKRSVQMGLIHEGALVNVGDVTVPVNQAVPTPGTMVEVRYLYAFPGSHKLIQAVYLSVRDDVEYDACALGQLKYKAPVRDDDDR